MLPLLCVLRATDFIMYGARHEAIHGLKLKDALTWKASQQVLQDRLLRQSV